MASTQQAEAPLTQEEVWDDSALINAWDEALEEYKKYHSIKAKGQDAEALVKAAEEAEMKDAPALEPNSHALSLDDAEEAKEVQTQDKIAPGADLSTLGHIDGIQQLEEPVGSADDSKAAVPEAAVQTDNPQPMNLPLPQVSQGFIIGGNNEALRNVMMSWYWAGYYTGLYEGQQSGQPPAPTS